MTQRVVFLINSLAGGGAERAICNLLANSEQQRRDAAVSLVLLDREAQAYSPPSGMQLTSLDSNRSLLRSVIQLYISLRRSQPDVVVSSLTRSNLANIAVSRFLGHRTIICEHAHTSGHHKGLPGRMAQLLIRRLYKHADRVICVSRGIKADLVQNFGVKDQRAAVVANPIDIDEIRHLGNSPSTTVQSGRYILGMGRFVESKNFPLLINAFAHSSYTGRLLLLGRGPLEEALKAQCHRLGIADRVDFLGFHRNPFPIIKGADAFVLASNGEGLPTSIIEALALGTPVISTDCHSGPAEILDDAEDGLTRHLRHGKYGILVPPNDVAALSNAISLLERPEDVQGLRTVAALGAERYGLMKAVARYWEEIAAVIEEGRRSR